MRCTRASFDSVVGPKNGSTASYLIVLGMVVALLVPDALYAQLIGQHVKGNLRVCVYSAGRRPAAVQRVGPSGRTLSPDPNAPRQVQIEARLDCPAVYDERADKIRIPAFSRLVGQERRSGQLICRYRYLQQVFVENKGLTSTPCPAIPGAW